MKKVNLMMIFLPLVLFALLAVVVINQRQEWQQADESSAAMASAVATDEAKLTAQLIEAQATITALQLVSDNAIQSAATIQTQLVDAETIAAEAVAERTSLKENLARQQKINTAYEAVLNSHLLRGSTPPAIEQSTLLAIEALERQNNPNTRFALQESLAILPQLEMEMETLHPDVRQLLWSGDGRFLLSYSWGSSEASQYQLWDAAAGKLLGKISARAYDSLYDWSADGRYLILDGWPDAPYVFDTTSRESILTLPNPTFSFGAALSPDNSLIAYSTDLKVEPDNDNSHEYSYILVVKNMLTGEEILSKVIEPTRERTVSSYEKIAFSADGRYVAGANFFSMDIWDLTTKQIVGQLPLTVSWPELVLFSTDNAYVGVAGFDGVQVWSLKDGVEVTLQHPLEGVLQTLRFSTDSEYLVGTRQEKWDAGEGGSWYEGKNGTQVWEMATGQEILHLPEVNVGASFISDTHNLLTANEADTIQVWDIDSGKLLIQSQLAEQQSVALHPTEGYIAGVNGKGEIHVWSPEPFFATQTIYPMTVSENYRAPDNLSLMAYFPDGTILATASWDGIIRFWDSETGQEQDVLSGTSTIRKLVFSPSGNNMVIGGGNYPSPAPDWEEVGLTYIQGISTDQFISLTHDIHIKDVAFAPDGHTFATVSNLVQIWNADTGEEIQVCAPDVTPLKIVFSPNGSKLIVLAESVIVVCDAESGETFQQLLPQVNSQFRQMALHPDGHLLAVTESHAVRVWNLETETIVTTLPTSNSKLTVFSPDGRYLGILFDRPSAQNSFLTIWEVGTWQSVMERPERSLYDFAFSPDSNYLALTNQEGVVWVVSLIDGREINRLQDNISKIQIAFRPDGKQIALLGQSEKVVLWTWNPGDWVNEACSRLSKNLTHSEWDTYFYNEPYRATCDSLQSQ